MAEPALAKLLRRAQRLHREGDFAGALAAYRKLLAKMPGKPELLILAATAALELGRLDEAESLAARAVKIRPDGGTHLTLGRVLARGRRMPEAIAAFRLAAADPSLAGDSLFLLGQAQKETGDVDGARESFEAAVRVAPGHVAAWRSLGRLLLDEGRPGEAIESLERGLSLAPGDASVLREYAAAALAAGRYPEADEALGRALAKEPDSADGLRLTGRLRKTQGRLDEAEAAWRALTERDPEDPRGWSGLAGTLQAAGELAAAGEAYDRGLELAPADPGLIAGRAEWLEWQGRYDEGLASLAGETDEVPGVALVRARLLRRSGRAPEARELLLTAAGTATDTDLQRQISFSLGDAADALGFYDEAFGHYERGNRLAAADWRLAAEKDWQDRLDGLSEGPAPGEAGRRMVFIVGLPRSGTTLVEQILAAHPEVFAGGESAMLGRLAHEAVTGVEAPVAGHLRELGDRYLGSLPAGAADATRVTDKMPLNFRYFAFLQAALPGARVVHVRRDLRDVAVSCFATDFIDPALGFATRIDWLGDYLRFYSGLMDRWRSRLSLATLELDYESLVREPGVWIPRLVEFAGLQWHEPCREFHRHDRVAATASHAQVREPVHTRSVGRWRHYREYLGALGELPGRPGG